MPFIDGKGRPELLVHPDIALGLANYRPVDEPEAPPRPLSEKDQERIAARQAAKKVIMDRKRREASESAQQKTGGDPEKLG